jgi:hypothetical protein
MLNGEKSKRKNMWKGKENEILGWVRRNKKNIWEKKEVSAFVWK